jgi:hypothetical protein
MVMGSDFRNIAERVLRVTFGLEIAGACPKGECEECLTNCAEEGERNLVGVVEFIEKAGLCN